MTGEAKTVDINKSQGEECRVPCRNCDVQTRHKVLLSVDIYEEESSPYFDYWYADSYQIVQCQGCDDVSFRKVHTNSEDIDHDPDTGKQSLDANIDVYPSRVAGRHKLRRAHLLPFGVSGIYDETHAALCNKQPILAGIGMRALIEAVCQEEQAAGRNLEQKIDDLVTLEVLTKSEAEMLHGTRILGNTAAHEVKPYSEVMLGDAMDVVEHLLTNVYILPFAAEKLPKGKKSN